MYIHVLHEIALFALFHDASSPTFVLDSSLYDDENYNDAHIQAACFVPALGRSKAVHCLRAGSPSPTIVRSNMVIITTFDVAAHLPLGVLNLLSEIRASRKTPHWQDHKLHSSLPRLTLTFSWLTPASPRSLEYGRYAFAQYTTTIAAAGSPSSPQPACSRKMPFPWMAASQPSNATDIDTFASLPSLGGKSSHASPLRQSIEESRMAALTRPGVVYHAGMRYSEALPDTPTSITSATRRSRPATRAYAIVAVLVRARGVRQEMPQAVLAVHDAWPAMGYGFSQQGPMVARLDDAAAVDPNGICVQMRLEADLAGAAQEALVKLGRRFSRLFTQESRAPSEGWVHEETEIGKDLVCRREGRDEGRQTQW
ncbi:hypothetical protein DOTSEDRAFT_30670 [Dothistroma septosporum NZE10]|uniref:Uncharacterized protein n=1 Tax=Dothistroma septosporum (strain NZE10 / CBS 128990) TaxID=675120 RepID=N1Q403_DOTSN|nr:hypothetical protein DOTSEDRAFT_30670 [Dothistroma septosporum NZE10]